MRLLIVHACILNCRLFVLEQDLVLVDRRLVFTGHLHGLLEGLQLERLGRDLLF